MDLRDFRGNILTQEEKAYRLSHGYSLDAPEPIDKEIMPYLERINKFSFICTTQSCCGHNEDPKTGRHAHIDFRSALSEKDTIDKILRPFDSQIAHFFNSVCSIQLALEADRLRYNIWLHNDKWKGELELFIQILGTIQEP